MKASRPRQVPRLHHHPPRMMGEAERLSDLEPDTAVVLARWGEYQLTVARTFEGVVGTDASGAIIEPHDLGFLGVQIEHLTMSDDGLPPFRETFYFPDPVMDALCRGWLNLRATESDHDEEDHNGRPGD
jgi:hypothetical protein